MSRGECVYGYMKDHFDGLTWFPLKTVFTFSFLREIYALSAYLCFQGKTMAAFYKLFFFSFLSKYVRE